MSHEAVHELKSRDGAEALKALAIAAKSSDQFLRRTAVEVIGHHPRGRELQAIILVALADTSGYVVRTACDVVARWKLVEAHDRVQALLGDPSATTRESALRALSSIWVNQDFPLVFGIYNDDPEIVVRREAASVLRYRATAANWQLLFDTFRLDELARHRSRACELAEAFSGAEILPVLSDLAEDVDGHVRKAASRAVQTISKKA
ncbi:HEAT repeat domain-containing protein [Bradyrhizobium sp.]|uniref:HEAT repeat domain-containing protein n=1 Tax=Bradyrhizobium sp. TaxID=376 RepID=UPI002D50EEF1|nr:HEAT repeat domain-containing protein [Bradyrhizobium sp.]HZR76225.1 HEAT repeat domain-containing protein [Bradyrhizobium sp.]